MVNSIKPPLEIRSLYIQAYSARYVNISWCMHATDRSINKLIGRSVVYIQAKLHLLVFITLWIHLWNTFYSFPTFQLFIVCWLPGWNLNHWFKSFLNLLLWIGKFKFDPAVGGSATQLKFIKFGCCTIHNMYIECRATPLLD